MSRPQRSAVSANNEKELLQKAFQLAFFIHPHEETAFQITTKAFELWDVICERQDKRRYYNLKGRLLGTQEIRKQRVKVSMQEEQLLQRLICKLSEEYESSSDWHDTVNEEGLLISYLKHLILLVLKHNSFRVMVGISRVLHRYSNREAVKLYTTLAPNRSTQDLANLERESKRYKSRIMTQLKERFGSFITPCCIEQEERFVTVKDPDRFAALFKVVEDCLDRFKPWSTECVKSQEDFIFNDKHPDSEYHIELKRIHSLIHYHCFSWLTSSLALPAAKQRLEIPLFSWAESRNGNNGEAGDRRNPPDIGPKLDRLSEKLNDLAKRRKKAASGVLSIIVDGEEKALLNPITESCVRLEITEDAEIIEVRKKKDGLLLATHLITKGCGDATAPQNYHVRLEAGQEINLVVTFLSHASEDDGPAISIDLWYQETALARVVSLTWQRLIYRITHPTAAFVYRFFPLTLAMSLAIIVIAGISLYFYLRPAALPARQADLNTNKVTPALPTATPPPAPDVSGHKRDLASQSPLADNRPTSPRPRRASPHATPPDFSERGSETAATLSSVTYIYIDLPAGVGDEKLQEEMESLINASGRLKVSASPIDAVLQYSVDKKALILTNKNNVTLWQRKLVNDKGRAEPSLAEIVADLIREIDKEQQKQHTQ